MSRSASVRSLENHPSTSAAGDTPVVCFEDVGLRYGRAPEVLRGLNFQLESGSFHFLTGASGAGKTSLLRLIHLAHRPTRGRVRLFGHDTSGLSRSQAPFVRRRIGAVYHDRRLLDHLNAFENVALPLRLAGQKLADYHADVEELLTWVGLRERMDALPRAMSGGEQQRLAIARAVVNRPELLIADEPTGDVDHEMALRILRLFVELNRLGATVLIASHDEELVARSGRPVLHLEGGRLIRRDGAEAKP